MIFVLTLQPSSAAAKHHSLKVYLINARMAWCFPTGRHNIWVERECSCLSLVIFLLPDQKCSRSANVNARVIQSRRKHVLKSNISKYTIPKNVFIVNFGILASKCFKQAPTLWVYLHFDSFYDVFIENRFEAL